MHFVCEMLKPYVFSLVFTLMSRNKGKFLLPADYLIQQSCVRTLRFPRILTHSVTNFVAADRAQYPFGVHIKSPFS